MNIRLPVRSSWMIFLLIVASLACSNNPLAAESRASPVPVSQPVEFPTSPARAENSPVNLPEVRENQASDPDSSANATRKLVSAGEKFVRGLLERPFNAEVMDTYFPHLDIVDTQGFKDNTWGFATISLSSTDANGHLPGNYALELDEPRRPRRVADPRLESFFHRLDGTGCSGLD